MRGEKAVSRVAYGLALIVDPEGETVGIGTYQGKGVGLAVLPQYRSFHRGRRTGRVRVSRFGKSHDLSAVIDGAGLPVVAAKCGKSAHMAVAPKKRNAGKVGAEAAKVFAVRIQISGL